MSSVCGIDHGTVKRKTMLPVKKATSAQSKRRKLDDADGGSTVKDKEPLISSGLQENDGDDGDEEHAYKHSCGDEHWMDSRC
jgi:hypothetical protein